MGRDLRKHRRIFTKKEVVINGIIKALALNISEGGIFVHTQAELIEGAVLDLNFEIDSGTVNVRAVVRNSQPGIGAGLRFLNLSPQAAAIIKKITLSEAVADGEAQGDATRILLVDDSAQSRAIYKNKLSLEGYSVVEASGGIEALKLLQEQAPDLVILDLWMEGMDGFKILQLMQLNPELREIPVVVLSARSVTSDIQKALSLGARDFLPKMTTTPIKLAAKVKDILAKIKK